MMEKRNPVMWKEAAVPRCTMPSRTVPSRTMHRCAVPPAATAVPFAASRQRGRSDQCSADYDRRCETSQFPFTHGVAPKDNIAPTQSGTGQFIYSMDGELNFAIDAMADTAARGGCKIRQGHEQEFMSVRLRICAE